MTARRPWPKLSESLYGPKTPERCQKCGKDCDLQRWQECDEHDQPTPVVVVLCDDCEHLITRHPRLYLDLHHNAPHPGTMTLCIPCAHRRGVSCSHPALGANGGAGLAIRSCTPEVIFCDGTDAAGSHVGWIREQYADAPELCAGRRVEFQGDPDAALPFPGPRPKGVPYRRTPDGYLT